MRHRIFALVLALSTLSAFLPQGASAQLKKADPRGDWAAVEALSADERIVVRLKEGDRFSGRFVSANDLLLNFRHGGRTVSFTRESILRVQLNRGTSRLNGALLGAAIGAGGGAGIGGWLYSLGDFNSSVVYAPAALGAGIGAGIGAAIGKGRKNETIYEAP